MVNLQFRTGPFFFFFSFSEKEGGAEVYEFSTGISCSIPRIGYARGERRNRWRGGKIKKLPLFFPLECRASCSSKLPRGATPNLFQTLYHERLTVSFFTVPRSVTPLFLSLCSLVGSTELQFFSFSLSSSSRTRLSRLSRELRKI